MNKQSERFYEILKSIKELHDKKRHDYGADEDIFANLLTKRNLCFLKASLIK